MKKISGLAACAARTIGEKSGGVEGVAAVMDDLQPGCLRVLVNSVGDEPRCFPVSGNDGNGLGLRALLGGDLEKARAVSRLRVGPCRMHGEITRVLELDRKSTRLNSSHQIISYAVFC